MAKHPEIARPMSGHFKSTVMARQPCLLMWGVWPYRYTGASLTSMTNSRPVRTSNFPSPKTVAPTCTSVSGVHSGPPLTSMTNSRLRGMPRSDTSEYSGSFSFLACWIWMRREIGLMPTPYPGSAFWICSRDGIVCCRSHTWPVVGLTQRVNSACECFGQHS